METNKLLQASMAESTWHTYRSACASFNQFRYLFRLPSTWPAPLDQVVHFIAYVSMQGRAPGSIRSLCFKLRASYFRAAFCLAFFGFLRVGELTCKSLRGHDPRPLQDGDIEIAYVDGRRMVKLTIRQSKTDQVGRKTTLFFVRNGVSRVSSFIGIHFQGSPYPGSI